VKVKGKKACRDEAATETSIEISTQEVSLRQGSPAICTIGLQTEVGRRMQPLRGNFFALKKPGQQMKNDKQQRKE
jgi:hypothetical protein